MAESTVELPDWYDDSFVNVENLFTDLFEKLFPGFACGSWEPDDWLDSQIAPDPMIWVFRLPDGVVDWQRKIDESVLQVSVVSGSRDDSWIVMNAIRAIILPFQGQKFTMSDGYTAKIHDVYETTGPQMLTPGQQIDTRIVTATFRAKVGMKSARNYGQFIATL